MVQEQFHPHWMLASALFTQSNKLLTGGKHFRFTPESKNAHWHLDEPKFFGPAIKNMHHVGVRFGPEIQDDDLATLTRGEFYRLLGAEHTMSQGHFYWQESETKSMLGGKKIGISYALEVAVDYRHRPIKEGRLCEIILCQSANTNPLEFFSECARKLNGFEMPVTEEPKHKLLIIADGASDPKKYAEFQVLNRTVRAATA